MDRDAEHRGGGALAGVHGVQRAGQTVEVAPIGRRHYRHRTRGAGITANGTCHRADKDKLDPTGVQPPQNRNRRSREVLVAFDGGNRSTVDTGYTSA